MKRQYLTIAIVMIFSILFLASSALADTILPGYYIKLTNYNSMDGAGIMTYAISNDNGSNILFYYDTFCIQDNTYVTKNVWYKVQSLTNQVGPYNFSGSPLAGEGPLAGAVDYLYYRYANGAYDSFLTNNLLNQKDLQNTLWGLQGSGPQYTPNATMPWAFDLSAYQSNANLHQSWGTSVINIVPVNFQAGINYHQNMNIQNQLYNTNTVPEPSSLLLLGGGLAAFFMIKRRK
jgi:hypothetical protein